MLLQMIYQPLTLFPVLVYLADLIYLVVFYPLEWLIDYFLQRYQYNTKGK